MSRPRFLVDHDMNEYIIDGARRREPSIELLHLRDAGLSRSPDAEVLDYAAREGFLTLTHDQSTMTAAAYTRVRNSLAMPGLLVIPQSAPIGEVIDGLLPIWSASEQEDWNGQVSYLPL